MMVDSDSGDHGTTWRDDDEFKAEQHAAHKRAERAQRQLASRKRYSPRVVDLVVDYLDACDEFDALHAARGSSHRYRRKAPHSLLHWFGRKGCNSASVVDRVMVEAAERRSSAHGAVP